MVTPLEVYRVAKLVLDQYGSEAENHIAERIISLSQSRELQGALVWSRIAYALKELRLNSVMDAE
jgi:hypothetical protein